VTGSSYIPIVVPIIAFLAMASWIGLVFYADSHPGYKHRKPLPVPDIDEPEGRADVAGGPAPDALSVTDVSAGPGAHEPADGHSSGPLAA
jgi:hypothetical protein